MQGYIQAEEDTGRYIQTAEKIFESAGRDISGLGYAELGKLLDSLERISLGIRQKMSGISSKAPPEPDSRYPEITNSPVKVEFDRAGKVLRIRMPLTLERDKASSWYLSVLLDYALAEYEEREGSLYFSIPLPACLAVVRRDICAKKSYRDNDNFEMTKAVNTVMKHLGYADAPDNLGYISLFRKAEDAGETGTEITVFSLDRLAIPGLSGTSPDTADSRI